MLGCPLFFPAHLPLPNHECCCYSTGQSRTHDLDPSGYPTHGPHGPIIQCVRPVSEKIDDLTFIV